MLVLAMTSCQSAPTTKTPDELLSGTNSSESYASQSNTWSSFTEEFVRRLDFVYAQHWNELDTSIHQHFTGWPPKQDNYLDIENWHYVQTLSKLVLRGVNDPFSTLAILKNQPTKNQSQLNAKVVFQSYLFQTVDDCASAVSVLSVYEPKSDAESALWAERIWSVFNSTCAYQSLTDNAAPNVAVQGWWDLAKLAVICNSLTERTNQYRRWKLRYPDHLADKFPPQFFRRQYETPQKIALLLPKSGPLSSAANAIKNGFVSAHLQTNSQANFSLQVYDTATTEITTLIKQIVDDGVDVIVGPLAKDNVRRVLDRDLPNIPMIALNRPPLGSHVESRRNVVQLAQVVEDDAVAVGQQLLLQDIRRVLLIRGDDQWCARTAASFRNTVEDSVAVVAETVLSDLSEVTENVAQLLHVTQSLNRQSDIARTTRRTIEFTARRRHDIDAIVAFVDQHEFAALSAALHYHFAGNIPVYLAEPTFRDLAQTGNYADGVFFTSTPAHLYPIELTTRIQESFTDASVLYPLYVFGIDVYRSTMQIEGMLLGEPIFGYTGYLTRDDHGVMQREPIWGRVEGRILKPSTPMTFSAPVSEHLW